MVRGATSMAARLKYSARLGPSSNVVRVLRGGSSDGGSEAALRAPKATSPGTQLPDKNQAAGAGARKPKLLDRLREALRSRHYSRRTEQTYCHWVKRYIFFHDVRHPAEMAEHEINAFLTNLAVKEKVSASTQTQALSALLFLYRHVLGREVGTLEGLIRARKPRRLPVVMTRDEVRAVIGELKGDYRVMADLMYGAGLRLMECPRLRVQDVDFAANQIVVRDGKGAQDRITMLAQASKRPLLEHLKVVREIHQRDLWDGWGRVSMPYALARKYPNAAIPSLPICLMTDMTSELCKSFSATRT